ncbi:MAG TPA: hypothetical protein VGA73_12825, partial [Candidatus Binatia bacterium]
GPADVIENGVTGILDEDLGAAALAAAGLDGAAVRAYALRHTWRDASREFLRHVEAAIAGPRPSAAASAPDLAPVDRV